MKMQMQTIPFLKVLTDAFKWGDMRFNRTLKCMLLKEETGKVKSTDMCLKLKCLFIVPGKESSSNYWKKSLPWIIF